MVIQIPIRKLKIPEDGIHLWIQLTAEELGDKYGVILDTGASHTFFDPDIMRKYLHDIVEVAEPNVSTIIDTNVDVQYRGKISDVSLGNFIFIDFPIVLMSLNHVANLYHDLFKIELCGVIGGDFLDKYKAEINYHASVLTIDLY
jgi:hypothetical protein